jgi:hypothetical protein
MSKVVRSSRKSSAVTQPQPVNPLLQMAPWSMLSLAAPYVESECSVICEWESHLDKSWEQLLVNSEKGCFYLNSSDLPDDALPIQIKTSAAVRWYSEKRMMDCVSGSLNWYSLHELMNPAIEQLYFAERVLKMEGAK